jgi:membrane protein implicated in regulation of membrane protease activity
MRNPFRSENEAFHFLLLTVGAFAIVIAASAGGTIPAIVAWAAVSAAAVALYARGRERREPEVVRHVGPAGERRIVVVAPLEASPLHRLANDVDAEQAEARARATAVVRSLTAPHVQVSSAVGEDPVAAVDDALHTFGGNEILVLPGDESLVARLRERYALPVSQINA